MDMQVRSNRKCPPMARRKRLAKHMREAVRGAAPRTALPPTHPPTYP